MNVEGGYSSQEKADISAAACPNCGRPVETHEMFDPPRCPVVRVKFPKDAADPTEAMVPYSAAASSPDSGAAHRKLHAELMKNDEYREAYERARRRLAKLAELTRLSEEAPGGYR